MSNNNVVRGKFNRDQEFYDRCVARLEVDKKSQKRVFAVGVVYGFIFLFLYFALLLKFVGVFNGL